MIESQEPIVEDEEEECRCGDFLKGIFIGGLAGLLAGIILAPKSGKELRSSIREKSSDIYEKANAKSREIIEQARRQAESLKKEADRYMAEARNKMKETSGSGGIGGAGAGGAE